MREPSQLSLPRSAARSATVRCVSASLQLISASAPCSPARARIAWPGLLIRSDVSLACVDGVAEALTAPRRREQTQKADRPREGDADERGSGITAR